MIGNSYAYGQTGYSILEQGDLNRETITLDVTSYIVTDPRGEQLGEFPTMEEAEVFLDKLLGSSE